ncbi:MAG: 4-(cytidine 5'-diphospho)-2-C-methyl-D-erythritol kinase [Clostridiales bacterium]|nr:4-(cytidine 5'-diphospho)-2-C-methyl-D-erythritol kinase [Clostridiales bacterium]
MRIKARAKINWTLDILGQREDGYHLMDMLMQPVSLADTITLTPAGELSLSTGGYPKLPANERNLAYRAAVALQEATGCRRGAAIHVEKRIPVGAGMGGGSADAAGVLAGLNRLWGTGLNQEQLEAIGLTLGADVPFCLRGGLTRTTGIGEKMVSLPCGRCYDLVVIQPCRGLSTSEVFAAYHEKENIPRPASDNAQQALASGDTALLATSLGNVLQAVSQDMRPPIGEAITALKQRGAITALMTGSGSAVFGVFATEEDARDIARSLRNHWASTFYCRTCPESLIITD